MAVTKKSADADTKDANVAAATSVNTSGAAQQIVGDVDLSHPAVDANPRANTTELQNKIDFNDPTVSGHEAVAKALNDQGVPTKDVDDVDSDEDGKDK